MVATLVLGTSGEIRVGSSPTWGTNKQGSYSGNTSDFQSDAESSILLPCSTQCLVSLMVELRLYTAVAAVQFCHEVPSISSVVFLQHAN